MTKLLLLTDSPVLPTGLAETTRLIFRNLLRRFPGSYQIEQVGLFHDAVAVVPPPWPVHPTTRLPNGQWHPLDKFGEITLREVCLRFQPDIVWGFHAACRLLHACVPNRAHKLVAYTYYDGLPMVFDESAIGRADHVVSMSDGARDTIHAVCQHLPREKTSTIYPPADTERFAPVSEVERMETRAEVFPSWMPQDAFVLGWIGRPVWRKQVWQQYLLVKMLRDGGYLNCRQCGRVTAMEWQPERRCFIPRAAGCRHCGSQSLTRAAPMRDVVLWAHFCRDDAEADWKPDFLEQMYDVRPGRDLHYTEGLTSRSQLPPESMPVLYQVFDALSYLSGGEGFGLPAWEAMASGLPVVFSDYSAHAEFLNASGAGLPVGVTLQPQSKEYIFRAVAQMDEAIEAVLKLYRNRQLGRDLGAAGRRYIEQFTTDEIAGQWHDLFQGVLAE